MRDLVDQMTATIPSDRLVMRDVVARFDEIMSSLPCWMLRRPVEERRIPIFIRIARMAPAVMRTARDMWYRTPALPVPPSDPSEA